MLLFMHLSLISLLDTNVNCLSWVNLLKFCMTIRLRVVFSLFLKYLG